MWWNVSHHTACQKRTACHNFFQHIPPQHCGMNWLIGNNVFLPCPVLGLSWTRVLSSVSTHLVSFTLVYYSVHGQCLPTEGYTGVLCISMQTISTKSIEMQQMHGHSCGSQTDACGCTALNADVCSRLCSHMAVSMEAAAVSVRFESQAPRGHIGQMLGNSDRQDFPASFQALLLAHH